MVGTLTGILTTNVAIAALLGAGVAAGVVLIVIGWHGIPMPSLRARIVLDRRMRMRASVAAGAGIASVMVTGWVVGAVLVAAAVWALPPVLGRDPHHVRRVARIEAIATWTEMLRDTLSAAAGLEQAILATAPLAPAAIRPQVSALAVRIENGDKLASALGALADDLADPTGDLVIASLVLASEQQARRLGDLLGSLAHAAREQASMRMRIEAGRARARTSVRVIVGTTLTFAAAVVGLNRGYLVAYDTATGQAVLLVVGGLFGLGFWWITRISTVSEPARFLTRTAVLDDLVVDGRRES